MFRIQKLFLLLTIIGPLHMGEQLLTSIEEFYSIQRLTGRYYALFDPAAADSASVILITIVWTICSLIFWALLREGTPRLIVLAIFGLFAATEIHHLIESFAEGGYDPGVITCIPYSAVGVLLLEAVWQEFRRERTSMAGTADLATAAH